MNIYKMAAALHMLADALVEDSQSRVDQLIAIAHMPAVAQAESARRAVNAVINIRAGGENVDPQTIGPRPIASLNGKPISLFEAKSAFDHVYRNLDYKTLASRVAE